MALEAEEARRRQVGTGKRKGPTAMSTAFNPADYGLSTELSADNLVTARKAYVELVNSLKNTEEKASQKVSIELTDEEADVIDRFTVQLRESVFGILDQHPNLSAELFDRLGDLRTDVKEFRDWHVSNLARSGVRTVAETSEEAAKARDDLDGLKTFIEAVYSAARLMFENGLAEAPTEESFPTKKLDSGAIVPDLPRLPKRDNGNGTSAGRKPLGSTLQFVWLPELTDEQVNADEETFIETYRVDIPTGTTLGDVVYRYVCSPTFRITPAEVFNQLPHTAPSAEGKRGHLSMTPGVGYDIVFPTGTLVVILPKKEEENKDEETPESE